MGTATQTQIESFLLELPKFTKQEKHVLESLTDINFHTVEQLGYPPNVASRIINSLLNKGKLRHVGIIRNPKTNRRIGNFQEKNPEQPKWETPEHQAKVYKFMPCRYRHSINHMWKRGELIAVIPEINPSYVIKLSKVVTKVKYCEILIHN